jgi:hypothetical protein
MRCPVNKSDEQLSSLIFRRNTYGFVPLPTERVVPIDKQWIAANPAPWIRVFSGQF